MLLRRTPPLPIGPTPTPRAVSSLPHSQTAPPNCSPKLLPRSAPAPPSPPLRLYNVDSNEAKHPKSTQSVFAIGDNFDPADIAQYRKDQGLPADLPLIAPVGTPNFAYECKVRGGRQASVKRQ